MYVKKTPDLQHRLLNQLVSLRLLFFRIALKEQLKTPSSKMQPVLLPPKHKSSVTDFIKTTLHATLQDSMFETSPLCCEEHLWWKNALDTHWKSYSLLSLCQVLPYPPEQRSGSLVMRTGGRTQKRPVVLDCSELSSMQGLK